MLSAVLVMAGSAARMNINKNKVFLPLNGKMVFQHSLDLFLTLGFEVVCVIRPEDEAYLSGYSNVKIAYGGNTRQESVYNGLMQANGEYVLIHDAARPFVTEDTLKKCISVLINDNGVLVATPVKDTIYRNNPIGSLKRDELYSAQTPQGADLKSMISCHKKAMEDGFLATDDITLLLKYSDKKVQIIESSDKNFKITTQLDYIIAKEMVNNND